VTRLYAQDTQVPVDRSKAEVERMLSRYGASAFASGWQGGKATLLFEANGRRIRFEIPMPTEREYGIWVTSWTPRRSGDIDDPDDYRLTRESDGDITFATRNAIHPVSEKAKHT